MNKKLVALLLTGTVGIPLIASAVPLGETALIQNLKGPSTIVYSPSFTGGDKSCVYPCYIGVSNDGDEAGVTPPVILSSTISSTVSGPKGNNGPIFPSNKLAIRYLSQNNDGGFQVGLAGPSNYTVTIQCGTVPIKDCH